jgi:hypothetical protein
MPHALGPPAALALEPVLRRDRRLRLTARLVGRLRCPPPTDHPPPPEVAHAPERPVCAPSSS